METPNTKLEEAWGKIEGDVIGAIKKHLLKNYPGQILKKFNPKLSGIVSQYAHKLPTHVAGSEKDDLSNIAKIELLETIKGWDPRKNAELWPLAYARITGAMKDHIRYVTKSDPTRLQEWISEAAYMYMSIQRAPQFENKIDNGVQLNEALQVLTDEERKIVVAHANDDKTFKQIGDEISKSESQVSRIYNAAVEKARKKINRKVFDNPHALPLD